MGKLYLFTSKGREGTKDGEEGQGREKKEGRGLLLRRGTGEV